MKVSCAVLITDGNRFLTCIPYGKKDKRDLPKGQMDPGETPVQTAVREVFEETGLEIDPNALDDLGRYPYSQDKDLHLFMLETQELPDIDTLECSSTFEMYGKCVPEMIGFEYLTFEQMRGKLYNGIYQILEEIFEE